MYLHIFKFYLLIVCLCAFTACRQPQTPIVQQSNTLRISMEGDPQTLDPRRVRDLATATVMNMLYEGLMRTGEDGKTGLALADSVTLSPDQKTYTFHLRPSAWSNGDAVTAQDFVETWKSLLNPKFPSPNAYQLYAIKGAQAIKEGRLDPDLIGVQALNTSTLVVELEQPTPYFLQLAATYFFYPVHISLRQQPIEGSNLPYSKIITNGPFKLENWNHHDGLKAIANPLYWDKNSVHLSQIEFIQLDNPTALQLFQNGELDWTGSPLSTISVDALSSLRTQNKLEVVPAAGVYLLRVNTEKPPFDDVKMRQAFALALNRADLVEYVLQGNQIPAFGLIPYSFLPGQPHFEDDNQHLALHFFQEALDKQGLTLETFPTVTLNYASSERTHKIAQVAQQQWKKMLGVNVILQSNDPKVHIDLLKNRTYQLGVGSWFADFRDPISFLEVFKFKDNGTNNTQWENQQFIQLLNASATAKNDEERQKLLKQAEHTLINEMPIIPLFYSSYNYVKNPALKGIYFSELGYLDFKHAYWDTE